MVVLRELRRRARFVVVPVLGMALSGYFIYHATEGERGLRAWVRLTQQMNRADEQLQSTQATHDALARKVAAMGRDGIDPDLLDQEVRATLNDVAAGQVVLMLPAPTH